MVTTPTQSDLTDLFYPCEDDEPLAESFEHLCAIFTTFSILTQYLREQQAVVMADQFLYYVQGQPSSRVAPDVMVILNVAPGGRGNYKIWEEGQVPVVIFEMTSEGTRERDWGFKKDLYAQLGVREYWLFDPKGEWIPEQLQGYRLDGTGTYQLIKDDRSEVLQLQLRPEGTLIEFYRLDTNEKLLTPDELFDRSEQAQQTIEQAQIQAEQERSRADQEKARADQLAARLRELGIDP